MFEFTRGGTKYTVKYGDGTSENFLVLSFYDPDQGRNRWPVMRDTDDIDSPIVWKGDEMAFLQDFVTL